MDICVTATASATVANQPSFDLGGFPVKVIGTIAGKSEEWETLRDNVTIMVGKPLDVADLRWSGSEKSEKLIDIYNVVEESDVKDLPTSAKDHTAGRLVEAAMIYLKEQGIDWVWPISVRVEKGISVKGTGLGSSGATPAATLKAFEEVMRSLGIDYVFGNHTKAQLLMNADRGVPDNSIPSYFGDLVELTHNDGEVILEKIVPGDGFGRFVIVTPRGFGINTAEARKALEGVTVHKEHEGDVADMQNAIREGNTKNYGAAMEAAHKWFVGPRSRLYPGEGEVFDQVRNAARSAGAYGVTISGAGPTMLAVAENKDSAWMVGEAMHRAFGDAGFDSVARLVEIDREGAKII